MLTVIYTHYYYLSLLMADTLAVYYQFSCVSNIIVGICNVDTGE